MQPANDSLRFDAERHLRVEYGRGNISAIQAAECLAEVRRLEGNPIALSLEVLAWPRVIPTPSLLERLGL